MAFENEFSDALEAVGLALPPEELPDVRRRVAQAAEAEGDALLDEDELRRRCEDLWGFREAARHLGISWRLAQKWARWGILPTLSEDEWCKGPVVMRRKHYEQTPLGRRLKDTTEEVRIVDLVFDADAIRSLDPEELREKHREMEGREDGQ